MAFFLRILSLIIPLDGSVIQLTSICDVWTFLELHAPHGGVLNMRSLLHVASFHHLSEKDSLRDQKANWCIIQNFKSLKYDHR